MWEDEDPLQQAISAARAGDKPAARAMFLEIIKIQPRDEVAWMWLTGLLDRRDDRIYACRRVLEINPNNAHVRQYLDQLLEQKRNEPDGEKVRAQEQAQAAREMVKSGKQGETLDFVRNLTKQKYVSADAWRLLAELSPDVDEQFQAIEQLLKLDTGDAHAQSELARIKRFQANPLDLAALYEEQGNVEKAIQVYRLAMLKPEFKTQWDAIYWKISALEKNQHEKIEHVSPTISIARLTFGPSLLYLVLLLVQVGVNPFAHFDLMLWFGLLWVMLGGFMIALASVRSHHRLWKVLFNNDGENATSASRLTMAAGGWTLVLLPHLMLFLVAFFRLANPG